MVRLNTRYATAAPLALLLAAAAARADNAAPAAAKSEDALPLGLGLSPEAPPVPPAPGGRAPSFGAPGESRPFTFRISGRIYGWEAVGVGRKSVNASEADSGTPIHMPALTVGKTPFWGGAGASLDLKYGNSLVTAVASYYFRMNRKEYQGYANPSMGPSFAQAYLLVTPDPIGTLRLTFRVGGFTETFAGPGQWGWGIFGPMLAVRGYGETTSGTTDLSRDLRLEFSHGVMVVPGVPEDFIRGDYNSWLETGVSSYLQHAHLGLVYKGYTFRLHYASDWGTDDRQYLKTALGGWPKDGRMDVYLAQMDWQGVPWGHFGMTGGLYNFKDAASVGDGVWWGVDWTQGARDMMSKFLGRKYNGNGNGKLAVVGAEYNFSVSSILWYPRPFNGDAPDLRVSIAAMITRTLDTPDDRFQDRNGYYFGIDTEYRLSRNFSLTFKAYGESRPGLSYDPKNTSSSGSTSADTGLIAYEDFGRPGTWSVYSLNPGIMYHTNWSCVDRVEIIYSRRFYSSVVDNNPAQPYDRHMIALGGHISF